MDMAKRRVRTPSNGSLHSTYTTYGSHLPSASVGSRGQVSAQRRPLRSISQNSTLPPSPGLLVNMLKTTTEMGDVATFPLQQQQQPVTPTAYHQFPRSRSDLVAATPPKYTPKRNENYYYAADGRPFRSYRDTTSEIISLYAYDNQPSYYGSGSPVLDDGCQRSYSITTNSSRCMPSHKTPAIVQSHSSGGELQRPRSPFPYPTRLKRPGVRSASPAVADNGCVDYSRMIELDRVSQRTVHNSYKPNSMRWARRPPPLSIRPDYSRSAASLPLRASPNPYYRSRTPSSSQSSASRYGRFERHPRMPTEHGERSPSLSSIVGMYRPPSSAKNSKAQSQMACHIYYDYSEDFDKPNAREIDIEQQPITHAVRYHDDGDEGDYGPDADAMASMDCAAQDENCSPRVHKEDNMYATTSNTARSSPNGEHGDCNQAVSAVSRLGEAPALRKLSQSAPPSGQQLKQVGSREDRETQNELASLADSPRSKLLRISKNLAGRPVTDQASDKTNTCANGNDAECSPDQSLPDFASIFGSFDLLDRSPYFKSTASFVKALDAPGDTRSIHSADQASHARLLHDLSTTDMNSTEELLDESGFSLSRPAQDKKLNILSPEPISPVRGLKVKNSIPQLMKALPPLPSKLSQYVQNAADNSVPKDNEQSIGEACCDEDGMQDGPRKGLTRSATRGSPSKFKVRVKPSTSQMRTPPAGASHSTDSEPSVEAAQGSASQLNAKPKLKIKISRSQLDHGHGTAAGAPPRVNRLKDCNSLADLALYSCKPAKVADSAGVGGNTDKEDSHSDELPRPFDDVHESPIPSTSSSPQPSDPFSIPYPSSSDDNATTNNRSISSSNKDTLVPPPSCSPDASLHHENGLRKKMSMFRLRLVESFSANAAKKGDRAEDLPRSESHVSIMMATKDSETNVMAFASYTSRSNKLKSDWMATRVKRWAMDAKRAVRSYVRRTLDRSPRRNE
ncbi:hypothetical protein E4U41_005183 [Claviceps citrina]|nr:hypothetical protein E4U41_005183 [Claviceps citrina]